MRVQTNINGIMTASSYQEGDCYSLVNLRKKNGTLHPVTERKTEFELKDKYDIVFVHSNSGYENWIGTKNLESGGSEVWWNINNEPELIFDTETKIISIEQIGNTLSLITEKEILYMLYGDQEYKVLGEIPEIEPIKWFNYGYFRTKSYADEYPTFATGFAETEEFRPASIGIFNVFRKKLYDSLDGCLIDSHLMVFAFRLYDGSYVKQTSPVLLCGNLFETASIQRNMFSSYSGPLYQEHYYIGINANKICLEFDLNYLNKWKDIIKSVDIFISNGLGKCAESNIIEDIDITIVQPPNPFPSSWSQWNHISLMKDDALMIENIKSTTNFYLIDSIPIGTVSDYDVNVDGAFSFPKKSVLSDIDLLIQRESLPVDSYSHHTVTGNISYTYNNRLHLADIKTALFKGFNADYFVLPDRFRGISFFGEKYVWNLDESMIPSDVVPVEDLRYNGFRKGNSTSSFSGILIAVDLNINSDTKTVYAELYSEDNYGIADWLNPFFSYPDSRAVRVRFYEIKSQNQFRLFYASDLTPSSGANYSYCLSTIFDSKSNINYVTPPPVLMEGGFLPPDIETIDIPNEMPSYSEENKLKVSALNNPFMFPNQTTYLVSNGKILNMASVATRISEGQFGQYPLYVFTNKGIYSMSIGTGEVVYATEAAPTSYEVPTTPVICITPFGVIFTSARGVCIISGQDVELLTYPLQQHPKELLIQSTSEIDEILLDFGKNPFIEYIETVKFIIYNPHENELIIHNGDTFNWVLCFDSKQFYQSTEIIDQVVENTFPDLKVIEGMKVKNYSQSGDDKAHVSLITRPLNFGTTDLKKLDRMFLRATIFNPVESIILNYYSIDEINFFALRGMKINPESRKDFDMGLFGRSKYRQFLFAFAGTVNEKSEIQYLESEIIKEYDNTKMR